MRRSLSPFSYLIFFVSILALGIFRLTSFAQGLSDPHSTVVSSQTATKTCGGHGDRDSLIVSTAWLSEHLHDPDVVLLAVGTNEEYDASHIPGARHVTYSDIQVSSPGGLSVELPPMPALADVFSKMGVTQHSRIVLYVISRLIGPMARVYVTLDAMGLGTQTSILDGGYPAWVREGRPTTTEVPVFSPGKVDACEQDDVITDLENVKTNLRSPLVALIDTRGFATYSGQDVRDGRAGHIPGATLLELKDLTDEKGKFKSADALDEVFRQAGARRGTRTVVYCSVGQQASLAYFVGRYLGYEMRLYDGSWQEWAKHMELPVEISTNTKQ